MNTGILIKRELELSDFSDRQILRYAGVKKNTDAPMPLIDECKREILSCLRRSVVYRVLPAGTEGDVCNIGGIRVKSSALAKAICGAEYVIIMAATLGVEIDRLIYKYSGTNTSKAYMLDAVAAERIEALCDAFCRELEAQYLAKGLKTGARFSPGYGDLPLSFQKSIFFLLEPHRHIGLTLNESLMMSPSKSVSAIIPLKGDSPL